MATLVKEAKKKTCPRCRRGQEVYVYLDWYEFDVDKARAFADDGREPVEVEEESVRTAIERSEMCDEHIGHVDPSVPGIISFVYFRTAEGETVTAHLLIDGHHRAARCLRDGLPFHAYVLSEAESQAIVVRSPDKPGRSLLDD